MNYTWSVPEQPYRNFWVLDYSRYIPNTLDELALNEPAGIGGRANFEVPVGPPNPICNPVPGTQYRLVPESGPVDWNCDGDTEDTLVSDCEFYAPSSSKERRIHSDN